MNKLLSALMSGSKEDSLSASKEPLENDKEHANRMDGNVEEQKEELGELGFDGVFDDLQIDDIYSDLKVDSLNDMNYNELKEKFDHSLLETKELKKEIGSLKRENEILKKNITALYLTARREIQRKDKEIKTLNDRAMRHRINAYKRNRDDPKMRPQSQQECNEKGKQEVTELDEIENKSYQSSKRKRYDKEERLDARYKEKTKTK